MTRNFTPYIYIIFLICFFQSAISQNFKLKVFAIDSIDNTIINKIDYEKLHSSDESITHELGSILEEVHKKGFLNSSIDSIKKNDSITSAYISLNEKFSAIRVYYNKNEINFNEFENWNVSLTDNYFEVDLDNLEDLMFSIVSYYEKGGKSFTKVSLKNIRQYDNILIADLNLNVSQKRFIDDIVINGYEEFPETFVKYHLNLKKNTEFNEDKLNKSSNGINVLPFANETKPPEILFTNDSTKIYLYLEKNKSNKFDGLIGFSTNERGKLEFNGYLDLQLQNLLNKGEFFSVQWKSNADDRKSFDLLLETPYIFNTPITPVINLNIYKQDSTFLNLRTNLALKYSFNSRNIIHFNYHAENSNDLRDEITSNEIQEYTSKNFGLGYINSIPDENLLYQNKFSLEFNGIWGNRVTTLDNLRTKQQRLKLLAYYNWQLNKKNYLYIKTDNAILFSENILENELFRIGGANSIRGFNEESIFASQYNVLNLEYRYYLTRISYLYSITDFAYVQNDINNFNSKLYSLGLGYTYNTNNGIIDLSYAIGKQENIPFDLQNSKFHIRLIQFF